MVDLRVDRGRRHPGVPQDLADLGERGPGCQHLGCQAVAEPVRAGPGDPGPVTGVIHRPGDAPRRDRADRSVCPQEHRPGRHPRPDAQLGGQRGADIGRQRKPVIPAALAVHGQLAGPPAMSSRDMTRPRRRAAPGVPAASASRSPGARAGSAGRSLPAASPPSLAAAPGAGLILSGSPRRGPPAPQAPRPGLPRGGTAGRTAARSRGSPLRAAAPRQLTGAKDAHRGGVQRPLADGSPRVLVHEQRRRLQVPGDHGRHQAPLLNQVGPVAGQ